MKLVFFLFLTLLASCTKQKSPIRIGLLPIPDALPLIVARDEHLFDDQNPQVELVFFKSAQERDAAYQAKRIDCALTDLVVVSLMQKRGVDIEPIFTITGQKKSGKSRLAILAAPQDLGQKGLGLAPHCIVDYAASILSKDLPSSEKVLIPNISLRLTMLLENQIAAAVLTDPYIDYAVDGGAKIAVEDSGIYEIVFAASKEAIQAHPDWFCGLIPIFNNAIDKINLKPEEFKNRLVRFCSIKESFKDKVELPVFDPAMPPRKERMEAIQAWLEQGHG